MACTLLESSFLPNPPASSSSKSHRKFVQNLQFVSVISCRSRCQDEDDDSSSKKGTQLAKLALVAMAAGVLTFTSVDPAAAAKTGGRVGGQAFRSAPPPRASGPRINNSRSNVFINPPIAPPLVGGYGYGSPFYGGWGFSPFSFFAPGPSLAVGFGGGLDIFVLFIVLSVVSSIFRRFFRSRDDEEDDY